MERLSTLFPAVCGAIDSLDTGDAPLIVALDGRCASGKTTLAGRLRDHYGCNVIQMDHFFLRPEQRTPERLSTPGGNVDHERFLEEVLLPLRAGKEFSYRPFDCGTFTFGPPVAVGKNRLTVVEGSYSCHEALSGYYDLRIFLTVDPAEQARRILARNGPEGAELFRSRWIPLEELYFSASRPDLRAHYCFDASAGW